MTAPRLLPAVVGLAALAGLVVLALAIGGSDAPPPVVEDDESPGAAPTDPRRAPVAPEPAPTTGSAGLSPAEPGPAPTSSRSIAGLVRDDTGVAVRGARIVASRIRGIGNAAAVTDARGRFRLVDIDETTYRLTIRAPGHVVLTVEPVLGGREDVAIELPRSGGIVGRITDASSGEPIAQCTVMLFVASGDRYAATRDSRRRADEGRYRFTDLNPGRYRVAIDAGAWVAPPRDVAIEPGMTRRIDFAAKPGGTIRGDVRTDAGTAVVGARVAAIAIGPDGAPDPATRRHDAIVEPDAGFVVPGLSRGSYRLEASAPGHCPVPHPLVAVDPGQSIVVSLRVVAGAHVRLHVTDARDRPIVGSVRWRIVDRLDRTHRGEASPASRPDVPLPVALPPTDAGLRTDAPVAPGDATVHVEADGYRATTQRAQIVAGRDVTIRIRLAADGGRSR